MQRGISLSKNGMDTKSAPLQKLFPERAEYCKTPMQWQIITPTTPTKILKKSFLKM